MLRELLIVMRTQQQKQQQQQQYTWVHSSSTHALCVLNTCSHNFDRFRDQRSNLDTLRFWIGWVISLQKWYVHQVNPSWIGCVISLQKWCVPDAMRSVAILHNSCQHSLNTCSHNFDRFRDQRSNLDTLRFWIGWVKIVWNLHGTAVHVYFKAMVGSEIKDQNRTL